MKTFKAIMLAVWLGLCLALFGLVIGVLAALNEQVGATSALVSALFFLIGGSLAVLYRPPNLPEGARDWIVQAAGLISLGLLIGLGLGFYLRYVDQARLMTGIARERAALDLELQARGQRLADYWGDDPPKKSIDVATVVPIPGPERSVTLRSGGDEILKAAVKAVEGVISRLEGEATERSKELSSELQTHLQVIRSPGASSRGRWVTHVEMAEKKLGDLKEDSAKELLKSLLEKTVNEDESR
jgi:hypothetical protein